MTVIAGLTEDTFLDPQCLRVYRSQRDTLCLELGPDVHEEINVRRAFPLDDPGRFIGLMAVDGTELGMVEDIDDLDAASREVLALELSKIYFLPVITAIDKIVEEYGVVEADIDTTSGPRHIEIRQIRRNIRLLPNNRALIEDADGNRYELRERERLPRLTRDILGL